MSTAGGPPTGGGFASGLITLYESFRGSRSGAKEIVVTLTLADNETLSFDGLRVESVPDLPGLVMVQGTSPASKTAVVVREDHIFKVFFEADPEPESPFGF